MKISQLKKTAHLGGEEASDGDGCGEGECDCDGGDAQGDVCRGAEVGGHEGEPDDAGGVHSGAQLSALVKRLRDAPRKERVHGGHDEQQDGVAESERKGRVRVRRAHQQVQLPRRVVVDGTRWRHDEPHTRHQQL